MKISFLYWNVSQSLDSKFRLKLVIWWFVEEDWKIVGLCIEQKKNFDVRNFRLLIAQIKVMKEEFSKS